MYDFIQQLKEQHSLLNNPYFRALQDGSFGQSDFVETQIQFLQAVVFFSRPMAMLAARLPRPEMRLGVLHNVWEEHGEGDLRQSHEHTFLTLLERLNVTHDEIRRRSLWPEVRAFNTALLGACSGDDVWLGAAALGMIEDLFSGISAFLGEAVLAQGWLQEGELIHYATHATLDVEHAADFYRILEKPYRDSPEQAYTIEQGLALGAYIFMQMYRGLFEARKRRAFREVHGPHSATDGWYLPLR